MWYLLQGTIFVGVVYAATRNPNTHLNHAAMAGLMAAYLITWFLSKLLDLLLFILRTIRGRHKQTSSQSWVHTPSISRQELLVLTKPLKRFTKDS